MVRMGRLWWVCDWFHERPVIRHCYLVVVVAYGANMPSLFMPVIQVRVTQCIGDCHCEGIKRRSKIRTRVVPWNAYRPHCHIVGVYLNRHLGSIDDGTTNKRVERLACACAERISSFSYRRARLHFGWYTVHDWHHLWGVRGRDYE